MGSENDFGESRVSVRQNGNYADSIIRSYSTTSVMDIDIPPDAECMSIEYSESGAKIVTLYKWKSRPDLVNVPESWKGEKRRFTL